MNEKEFLESYDVTKYERPSVTADIIIFTMDEDAELNVLLIKRKNFPFKDHWAIAGGFINAGKESIDETASRELYEETGIKVSNGIDLRQLMTVGTPDRDPRTHVISVVYTALVPKGLLTIKAGDDAKEAKLFKIRKGYDENGNMSYQLVGDKCSLTLKNLAFDHAYLLTEAIKRIQNRLDYTDDAFSLLQNKSNFEILELVKIHEAITFQTLDKANFRKKFIHDYVKTHKVMELGKFSASGKPKTMRYSYLGG